MNDIYELCKGFTKKENVEFTYIDNYKESASIFKYGLSKTNNLEGSGLLIRVLEKGQSGSTTITKITKENIIEGIKKAKRIAKLKNTVKIPDFGSHKTNKKIKTDKALFKLDLSEILPEIKQEITKEKHIKSYEGVITKVNSKDFYLNPYTSTENHSSALNLSVMINTKDKKPSSAYFSQIFTKKEDIDVKLVFDQAKENAKILLNPVNGTKDKYTLIFTPEVLSELLGLILAPATGDAILKKQSYLLDQLNKQVFSKNLTITEDPHLDYFLDSCFVDDEGIKTTKKEIIKDGVFKKIIYSQEKAIESKNKPTGNGFRGGLYSATSSSFSNIIVAEGKEKINDIIAKTKKGVLVYGLMGLHTSNTTTGEFSLVINQGKEIINGKLKNTITNLNFTGNCKESFKDLYFSKEQRFFGASLVPFGVLENVKLI